MDQINEGKTNLLTSQSHHSLHYGVISRSQCKIIKDDGRNTNIIYTDFIIRYELYSKTMDWELSLERSNENSIEVIRWIVLDATN